MYCSNNSLPLELCNMRFIVAQFTENLVGNTVSLTEAGRQSLTSSVC